MREDSLQRRADLFQVIDILLGKMHFYGVNHDPGKREKEAMVARLMKNVRRVASEKGR